MNPRKNTRSAAAMKRAFFVSALAGLALWMTPSTSALAAPWQDGEAKKEQESKPKEEPKEKPQEKPKKIDETDIEDLNPFEAPPAGPAGNQEMIDLFMTVEKRLDRVTELLFEASSGDTGGAGDIGSARIDELIRGAESQATQASNDMARLLEATRRQSQAASEEIGRILKLAEQSESSSSSGSSGGKPGQKPQSGQPSPQQGQTSPGSRREDKGENGPEEESKGKQEGEEQGKDGEKPEDGEKPQDGDQPKGSQESEGGKDGKSKQPPEGEKGAPSNAQGNEEWGDLPVHLRKVFENGVSDDVPARYRGWVDSYYKRLNRRSGR